MHEASVLVYYARLRFITNLLPHLQRAPHLRRVVTVFAGTKEGKIDTSDFQARKIGMLAIRGHTTSMVTLSLEAIAEKAPNVGFVHAYPGFVKTGIARGTKGVGFAVMNAVLWIIGPLIYIPNEEVGERMLFLATSARYAPAASRGHGAGLPLVNGTQVANGTTGVTGAGVYSVDESGESARPKVVELLAALRKERMTEKVWGHTQKEFNRITGTDAV